jgi:nitronate monooxygenase
VPPSARDSAPPNYWPQCDAARGVTTGRVIVMGVYPPEYVARLRGSGIAWFAMA